jgi:RNA polymerase sigma-70 factor (ECF subfamily)
MGSLVELVTRAQQGDVEAFGQVVRATHRMSYAVAKAILGEPSEADDAVQDAYLRAFRRLWQLKEPLGFVPWLRRIVVGIALNARRSRRVTWLSLDEYPDLPVLDDEETYWSDVQRLQLASALLTLTSEERQLCDRRYHGGWSTARLAKEARVDEAVVRKRLQRLRNKLRKEIEVAEQRNVDPRELSADLPAKIVELLTRPKLTDLPENPVGKIFDELKTAYGGFEDISLPEIVNFAEARTTIGDDAFYITAGELHRIDDRRILRYDLTLPLLMTVRYEGKPIRLCTAGKAYRLGRVDATHLEAFHQAEVFCLDDRRSLDPWSITARVLRSVNAVLPNRVVKIVPTHYAMCSQAWELEVEEDGRWSEVLAWGVFTDRIVEHVGADPATHAAIGVGYGLERLAMLRYRIDDIRKVDIARVA